eukprot:gene14625-4324_t
MVVATWVFDRVVEPGSKKDYWNAERRLAGMQNATLEERVEEALAFFQYTPTMIADKTSDR